MISNIRLQQFRSYSDQSFEFTPGVNIIVGANASGKTNLLEGILYSCQGKSYRSKDINLINYDKDWCSIEAYINNTQQRISIEKKEHRTNKSITIEDKKFIKYPSSYKNPVVLFEPENLRLLTGSPELRRDFLDSIIEQTTPRYSSVVRDYQRVLAQRNALLKSLNSKDEHLFAWDVRLVDIADKIHKERTSLIKNINEKLSETYSVASNKTYKVVAVYKSSCESTQYASALIEGLEKTLKEDRLKGFTSLGPHREDVEFIINGHPAQSTASRGETRTLVISLKIIELEIKKYLSDKETIVLLDDVFSELDGARRTALTGYLKETQTFITTTDADILAHKFTERANTIAIN